MPKAKKAKKELKPSWLEQQLESRMHDAYTSVEALLYQWFQDRGQGIFPGKLGRGDIQDLAVRVSVMMKPFRNFYRAHQGWDGYDLNQALQEAQTAEREI